MSDTCERCGRLVTPHPSLVEGWEETGDLLCEECWEEQCEEWGEKETPMPQELDSSKRNALVQFAFWVRESQRLIPPCDAIDIGDVDAEPLETVAARLRWHEHQP